MIGHKSIHAIFSVVPFCISLVVAVIAAFATIKRKDLFFSIDHEKIEFRYGVVRPKKHSVNWEDIKEVIMPRKQKKVMFSFKDGSSFVINLTWLQRKKTGVYKETALLFCKGKKPEHQKG